MALQLQLHPNVAPLFGQAQVAARGPNPQLMCDQGHTLVSYNANWITTQQNFGPGGEVGIDEGDIASFLANAVRASGRAFLTLMTPSWPGSYSAWTWSAIQIDIGCRLPI